jgi:hypothetical protein
MACAFIWPIWSCFVVCNYETKQNEIRHFDRVWLYCTHVDSERVPQEGACIQRIFKFLVSSQNNSNPNFCRRDAYSASTSSSARDEKLQVERHCDSKNWSQCMRFTLTCNRFSKQARLSSDTWIIKSMLFEWNCAVLVGPREANSSTATSSEDWCAVCGEVLHTRSRLTWGWINQVPYYSASVSFFIFIATTCILFCATEIVAIIPCGFLTAIRHSPPAVTLLATTVSLTPPSEFRKA